VQPRLQFGDERAAALIANARPLRGRLAVDVALDREQRIDPLDRFDRNRRLVDPRARSKNLRRACAQHIASTIGPGLRLAS
jgi:hypothetical protein